jgi:hypothetical protein
VSFLSLVDNISQAGTPKEAAFGIRPLGGFVVFGAILTATINPFHVPSKRNLRAQEGNRNTFPILLGTSPQVC